MLHALAICDIILGFINFVLLAMNPTKSGLLFNGGIGVLCIAAGLFLL